MDASGDRMARLDSEPLAEMLKFRYAEIMSRILSVNERGTLTLPKDVWQKLGLDKSGQIMLECDESGQVVLRACAVLPIEIYTEERMTEFQEAEAGLEPFMPGIRAALTKLKADSQASK